MSLKQDQLQAVIETCEFDRWMGLLIRSLDESTLTVMLPFRTEIVGTPKIKNLHGGVVASLIDATGCYLLIGRLTVVPLNVVVGEEGQLAESAGVRGPLQGHGMRA